MKGRSRRLCEKHLEINLINQYASVSLSRQLANFFQRFVIGQNATGIMEVSEHDQSRAWAQVTFDLNRRNAEAVLKRALETFDVGAKVVGQCDQRLICRTLEQYLVADAEDALGCHGRRVAGSLATATGEVQRVGDQLVAAEAPERDEQFIAPRAPEAWEGKPLEQALSYPVCGEA